MNKLLITLVSLSISTNALAFKRSTDVNEVIDKSIQYLNAEQFKQDQDLYTAGEWPADMRSYFLPALLGVGKLFAQPTEEPTSFATSSVMNLLAETYFAKPSLKQIPEMINLGITSLSNLKMKMFTAITSGKTIAALKCVGLWLTAMFQATFRG